LVTQINSLFTLIGLKPVPVDEFDDISAENPSVRDVIVVGQPKGGEDPFAIAAALKVRLKSAGLFKVVVGPTKTPKGDMAFDRLLPRPFLREAMMTGLSEMSPLVAPPVNWRRRRRGYTFERTRGGRSANGI